MACILSEDKAYANIVISGPLTADTILTDQCKDSGQGLGKQSSSV